MLHPTTRHRVRAAATTLLALALGACATMAPPRTDDPLEKFNRKVYVFNDTMDRAVIRPVAVTYRKVTTPNMRRVLNNFFANLRMPVTIVNDVLQGDAKDALRNSGRFVVNTTLGFVGLFDPASRMHMPRDENDFGVTLAHWGMPEGPYIVLPFVGSTTLRDVWRLPVDSYADPLAWYAREHDLKYGVQYFPSLFYLVTLRASAIDAENLLEGVYDPYVFYRDAYRQRRLYLIYDGEPPIEVLQQMQGIDDVDVDQLLDEQRQYEQSRQTPRKEPPQKP